MHAVALHAQIIYIREYNSNHRELSCLNLTPFALTLFHSLLIGPLMHPFESPYGILDNVAPHLHPGHYPKSRPQTLHLYKVLRSCPSCSIEHTAYSIHQPGMKPIFVFFGSLGTLVKGGTVLWSGCFNTSSKVSDFGRM